MMKLMPKTLPVHVTRVTTRHGRIMFYFRRSPGQRIHLRADCGTLDFAGENHAALTGQEALPRDCRLDKQLAGHALTPRGECHAARLG
jgi:hypothetical protein